MTNQLTINARRLSLTLAISAPVAIAVGIGWAKLQWMNEGTISLPEMCITAMPDGETSVSRGSCDSEDMAEI